MILANTSRRVTAAIVLCCTIALGSSCSLKTSDFPSPKAGVGSGFDVTIEFASAMNLPNRANVMMDGLNVGEVREVRLNGMAVDVAVRIKSGTEIPTDIHAVVRQDTLLGDTYVALDRNRDAGQGKNLENGGIIPLERTSSPPQIEDTMAVLATFVNGGSIQKVEDTMRRINAVMPDISDVRDLASTVAIDLQDLSRNTVAIDGTLQGINETAISIDSKSAEISTMFTPEGMHYWKRINENVLGYVGTLLPSIGSIFEGGMWLVPMLNSLAGTAGVVRSTGENLPSDVDQMSNFLRTTILPFLQNPRVNILSVNSSEGTELITDIENVLRMLGAMR